MNSKAIGNWFADIKTNVKQIMIGESVESIAAETFNGFTALEKVIAPNLQAWCGFSFSDANHNPLYYAKHLYSDEDTEVTSIVVPDGVKSIGQYAFQGCEGIKSVTIPASVTSIGKSAFSCGINLEKVTSLVKVPFLLDESAFAFTGGVYSEDILYMLATLYVPKGRKTLYNNVEGWKKFTNVVELESTAFKLTYMVDGEVYKTYDVEATTAITPEAEPVKEGFIFSGWSGLPSVMPAEDVVVTGTFTADPDYTAVEEIRTGNATPAAYYSISGKKMNRTERGLNIIRMSDGTVRKVVVK